MTGKRKHKEVPHRAETDRRTAAAVLVLLSAVCIFALSLKSTGREGAGMPFSVAKSAFTAVNQGETRAMTTYIRDFPGRILYRIEGDRICEFTGNCLYRLIGNRLCTFTGTALYVIENGRVSEFAGRVIYRMEGNTVREFAGKAVYRIEGDRITDFYGRTLYRIDGPISQTMLLAVIMVIEKGEVHRG